MDGEGNIDIDPMFINQVDPSSTYIWDWNLRLKSGSPAIDAGNNVFVTDILTDLDEKQRVVDGDLDGTATVDMGAYETQFLNNLPLVIH